MSMKKIILLLILFSVLTLLTAENSATSLDSLYQKVFYNPKSIALRIELLESYLANFMPVMASQELSNFEDNVVPQPVFLKAKGVIYFQCEKSDLAYNYLSQAYLINPSDSLLTLLSLTKYQDKYYQNLIHKIDRRSPDIYKMLFAYYQFFSQQTNSKMSSLIKECLMTDFPDKFKNNLPTPKVTFNSSILSFTPPTAELTFTVNHKYSLKEVILNNEKLPLTKEKIFKKNLILKPGLNNFIFSCKDIYEIVRTDTFSLFYSSFAKNNDFYALEDSLNYYLQNIVQGYPQDWMDLKQDTNNYTYIFNGNKAYEEKANFFYDLFSNQWTGIGQKANANILYSYESPATLETYLSGISKMETNLDYTLNLIICGDLFVTETATVLKNDRSAFTVNNLLRSINEKPFNGVNIIFYGSVDSPGLLYGQLDNIFTGSANPVNVLFVPDSLNLCQQYLTTFLMPKFNKELKAKTNTLKDLSLLYPDMIYFEKINAVPLLKNPLNQLYQKFPPVLQKYQNLQSQMNQTDPESGKMLEQFKNYKNYFELLNQIKILETALKAAEAPVVTTPEIENTNTVPAGKGKKK